MKYQMMSEQELTECTSGAAITLAAVMAVLATAIVAVVAYRLFMSSKGTLQAPGGWKISWN